MLPPLPPLKPGATGYTPEQVYEYGRWVAARAVSICHEVKDQIREIGGAVSYSEGLDHVAGSIQRRLASDTKTVNRE
jgi:hypothetical protein